jgi:hypothetical protein
MTCLLLLRLSCRLTLPLIIFHLSKKR